jgi:uncharacterized protein (DUF4415 family)
MAATKRVIKTGITIRIEILEQARREDREARKHPIVYDEDCPKLTPEQLAEFKPVGMTWEERNKLMAERRARKNKRQISIRVSADCLDTYKALGRGYTAVMADVLAFAAVHPDILKQASR